MRPTIPLAALRPDLECGWRWDARWRPNGHDARANLEQPAETQIHFRLHGLEGALLRTTVALAEDEPGLALCRARISLALASGEVRTAWKGMLGRVGGRAIPRRLEVSLEGDEADLVLAVSRRVVWGEPSLELPALSPAGPPFGVPAGESAVVSPAISSEAGRPLISVLMPVHDPPPDILEEAIASVREQTMGDWELCLADDGSSDDRVREILARSAAADERVKLVRREQAGGISAATNSALAIARGEYIALLDHDDTLVPDALAAVATVLAERPQTDWVYSDEEVVKDGVRVHVYTKPAWSPDLLRSQMYVCHLGVYRRRVAEEIGGFRSDFDGSQDYDFALRFSERTDRIAHIPRVLYRWRAHSGSVAGNPHSKPGAYPAARRAIDEHLDRTGCAGEAHFGPWPGLYRVVHRLDPQMRVGVVIAAAEDAAGIEDLRANLAAEGGGLKPQRVVVVPPDQLAATNCEDLDVIVLLEGAAIPLTRGWLARIVGFAAQPGVGAAGAKVIARSGLVEQAGLAVAAGTPVPLMPASGAAEGGPLAMAILPSNVAAVGGVLATAATTFEALGGLDSDLGGLSLPDYCLRARERGLRTVLVPDAILRRPAGAVPINDLPAIARFQSRWAEIGSDPYFDFSRGWPGAEFTYPTG